jgi:multidrug efflux system membrane fusion protein
MELQATGTVEPEQTVRVQAQVTGTVVKVGFKEGDQVRKGQVLFELDRRPYAAQLAEARAGLARDEAQLANARSILARNEQLALSDNIAQQALNDSRTQVEAFQATLAADSALVEQARLSLEFATIRAPISGRAGGLLVRPGNLVRANAAEPLVVINQLRPILVRFALPVAQLGSLAELAKQQPMVEVTLPGGATRQGRVSFLDNAVDTTTGTVLLKARFANDDEAFWPGQFLTVRMRLGVDRDALVVPATAVVPGQEGNYVFVLKADSTVAMRSVAVGRTTGQDAVLTDGVSPGELVVTDGQIRLRDGARVAVSGDGARTTLGADGPPGEAGK